MRLLIILLLSIVTSNAFGINYYWVGGSGKWSEYNLHWSTTSGGTTFHNQVPTNLDNVYFDSNSGFTNSSKQVTIDQTIVYCNDMDWTGATNIPILNCLLNTSIIKIHGSLNLISAMNYQFDGKLSLESITTGNTITTSNKQLPNIYFNGIGGEWMLNDSLKTTELVLSSGILNSNNQVINAMYFSSSNSNIRGLILGNKNFHTFKWDTDINTNFFLNAGTSSIRFYANGSGGEMKIGFNNLSFHNVYVDSSVSKFQLSGYSQNFHKLVIKTSIRIISSGFTYDSLILLPGITCELSDVHKINSGGRLIAFGNCQKPIFIYGQNNLYGQINGTFDISQSAVTSYTFNYLYLSNTTLVKGSLTASATNSLELENAVGWNIVSPSPRNLYWVGGSGLWTDIAHWSTTSGGIGGACIPGPTDNVYFNANSGFTSNSQFINANNVSEVICNTMDWTGVLNNPIFSVNDIRIFGSLIFSANMTAQINRNVYFQSPNLGNTIRLNGKILYYNVYFNGTGEWILQDDFKANRLFSLSRGTIRTNNQKITMGSFYATSGAMYMGNSEIIIKCTDQNVWYTPNSSFILNAGTSTVYITDLFMLHEIQTSTNNYSNGLTFYNFIVEESPYAIRLQNGKNNFHKLNLKSNAFFETPNTYDSLVLKGGYVYSVFYTQTINMGGDLVAKGSCNEWITLLGDVQYFSTISKSSGAITLEYVIMNDLIATGGASYTANNSIDKGGNTGWTINTPISRNLYWVGGAGNWFDESHWALSSGGLGGYCVPSPFDNVFFDNASSFSLGNNNVIISGAKAYCKNMDWTGATSNPIFTLNEMIHIYGSMTLIPNMNFVPAGRTVSFESDQTGNTIQSYGKNFFDIIFNNPKGEWSILDSIAVINSIRVSDGKFRTNGNALSAAQFSIVEFNSDTVSIELGSSTMWLKEGFLVNGDTTGVLHFDAGTSEIILKNSNANAGYLSIHFAVFNQGLIFHNLTIQKGIKEGSIIGINTFHKLSLGSSTIIENYSTLDHLILTPGKTYTLWKSIYFSNSGILKANGEPGFPIEIISAIAGTQIQFYKENGIICGDYLYLKDIEATGGALWYAGINSADVSNNTGWLFELCPLAETKNKIVAYNVNVIPNPTSGSLSISFYANENYESEVILREATGKEVKRFNNKIVTGENEFTMDLSGLETGIYFLEITTLNGKSIKRVIVI